MGVNITFFNHLTGEPIIGAILPTMPREGEKVNFVGDQFSHFVTKIVHQQKHSGLSIFETKVYIKTNKDYPVTLDK